MTHVRGEATISTRPRPAPSPIVEWDGPRGHRVNFGLRQMTQTAIEGLWNFGLDFAYVVGKLRVQDAAELV